MRAAGWLMSEEERSEESLTVGRITAVPTNREANAARNTMSA